MRMCNGYFGEQKKRAHTHRQFAASAYATHTHAEQTEKRMPTATTTTTTTWQIAQKSRAILHHPLAGRANCGCAAKLAMLRMLRRVRRVHGFGM